MSGVVADTTLEIKPSLAQFTGVDVFNESVVDQLYLDLIARFHNPTDFSGIMEM
ncbi:hypothetical protein [Nitrosomonas supralitoralis]|uniref:hypothetical protein n=1 Tax=Nitrosomonas supralitoralis TaxID=2116706 RepID=UPI00155863A6|nr:hypothetical protein [Nitrosomonas supralitoralis]